MEKLDLSKTDKTYYSAKSAPQLLVIPKTRYISILGKGDPNGLAFATNVKALYATAYLLKFAHKARGNDFTVPKLEGLWWHDSELPLMEISKIPVAIPREQWHYRLLIRLPDFVSADEIPTATVKVVREKQLSQAQNVQYFELNEGKCIQILHTGPFSQEPKTLALITNFAKQHQLDQNGYHHEIYLSDFRKTASEKLRTILREPVK